ncbi:MAG: hypothetical protein ACXVFZ_10695 [Blastococcus sp.]
MDPYAGFEPCVGEIRALRTFRVGPGGRLYPLFTDAPWQAGENTALCRLPRRPSTDIRDVSAEHRAPDPECSCGFYAYGSEAAAAEYPHARHVLGVVTCWGRVIAGTRGLRAEHCRIEALWLSENVPADLSELVRASYPSAAVYRNRTRMLAEHPATPLDCYELDAHPRPSRGRLLLPVAALTALVVGALPRDWLGGPHEAAVVWSSIAALFVIIALAVGRRRPADPAAHRRRLLAVGVVVWSMAPFVGLPGLFLLRLPLLELGAVAVLQRRRFIRAARQFPARIG